MVWNFQKTDNNTGLIVADTRSDANLQSDFSNSDPILMAQAKPLVNQIRNLNDLVGEVQSRYNPLESDTLGTRELVRGDRNAVVYGELSQGLRERDLVRNSLSR